MSAKSILYLKKDVLFELVEKHKDIIESKKNDGKIVENKKNGYGTKCTRIFPPNPV